MASINFLAVIVAAIVNMVVGAIWFTVFRKTFLDNVGKSEEELGSPTRGYIWSAVASLVMAYVLARFVDYAGAATVGAGISTGLWAGIGFIATAGLSAAVFENRSTKLYILNTAYHLVSLAIMGAILAVWS